MDKSQNPETLASEKVAAVAPWDAPSLQIHNIQDDTHFQLGIGGDQFDEEVNAPS